MTFMTTTEGNSAILPDEYAALITEPVTKQAAAFNPAVARSISTTSTTLRVPVLKEDAGAEWVAEGQEITPDDPTLGEIPITPAKVAGLTIVSRELAEDSSPDAATIIGESLARSIVEKIDAAFFTGAPAPAPRGLPYYATEATSVSTGGADATERGKLALYSIRAAVAQVKAAGATPTAIALNPSDAFALSTVTESDTSRRTLLDNVDTVDGLPVVQNRAVTAGRAWILDASNIVTVRREETTLAVSDAPFFTSDRVAIRATMRVGFGVLRPQRLGLVALDGTAITAPAA